MKLPPMAALVTSAHVAPPSVEISSTVPSNPLSRLNWFEKVSIGEEPVMLMPGVTRRLSVTQMGSSWKAALGALLGKFVVVTQLPPRTHVPDGAQVAAPFVNEVVHPAGSAGAVTPSKFSAKTMACTNRGPSFTPRLVNFLSLPGAGSSRPPQGSPEAWTHS